MPVWVRRLTAPVLLVVAETSISLANDWMSLVCCVCMSVMSVPATVPAEIWVFRLAMFCNSPLAV